MPSTIIPISTSLKPQFGSTLNKYHPYSRNMVGCFICNEGKGKVLNNLAKNSNMTMGSANKWKSFSSWLPCLYFDNTANSVLTYPIGLSCQGLTEYTVMFETYRLSQTGATYTIYYQRKGAYSQNEVIYNNGSTTQGVFYTRDTSNGDSGARDNDVQFPNGDVSGNAFPLNTYQNYAFVYSVKQSIKAVYRNGVLNQKAINSIDKFNLAFDSYTILPSWSGYVNYIYFWDYALTPLDYYNIYKSPFQMINQRRKITYSIPSSANYQQVIIL